MMNNKKIIVYVVPHTHWDREWYFTHSTSEMLLSKLFNDLNRKENVRFTLDGQASLLESFTKINNIKNSNFIRKIKKGTITIGPLYVQNDTFNVMFNTTQSNIEIGKQIVEKFSKNSSTIYMPDSFGFNEQLPQIFKKNGFKNFVTWRGIKVEDINKSNLFNWVGIDGTKICASVMADGYYVLGQHYPYNFSSNKNLDIQKFKIHLIKQVNIQRKRSLENIYWIPLGGDQAPYEFNLQKIIDIINLKCVEYKFILSNHDDYFNTVRKQHIPELNYPLYYSGNSKIHRTIHSNRYDIKQLFRKIELLLYYRVEQLEIMYKEYGGKILNQQFKDEHFYKPLLKCSAHDSLGGCNSDLTNSIILCRLNVVYTAIRSYIDSMIRDIKENIKLDDDEYIIFNSAPFKQSLLFIDDISTNNCNRIATSDLNVKIIDYKITDFSFKYHKPTFNHKVAISVPSIDPFSYKIVKLINDKSAKYEKIAINFQKQKILINHQGNIISFKVMVEDDFGDEYDFSTNKLAIKEYFSNYSISETLNDGDLTIIKFQGYYLSNRKHVMNFDLIKNDKKILLKIHINNKLKNKKISLVFPLKNNDIKLSRHLAIVKQVKDKIKNWKKLGYKDKIVNSFSNDGYIGLDNDLGIYTRGNNEVLIESKNIKLTLSRFVGYLGKPELSYRPGAASGLPFKVHTPDAQLQKHISFTIGFAFNDTIKNLNEWYFTGFGCAASHTNPLNKLLDQFVINKAILNIKKINSKRIINNKYLLIGRYKKINKKLSIITSNPRNIKYLNYKPYEIKFS